MIGEMVVRTAKDESKTEPAIWDYCDMLLAELSEAKKVECVIPFQPHYFLPGGVVESDQEQLNSLWESLTFKISINGQPIDLDSFGTIDALGGRNWNVVLENPTHGPHRIETIVSDNEDPSDRYGMTLDLMVVEPEVAELSQQVDASLPTLSSGVNVGQHPYYSENAQLDFLLYVPTGFEENSQQEWPMIVFLHGGIPRSRLDMLSAWSLPKKLEKQSEFPFIVVSPRVLGDYGFWAEDEKINALITLLEEIQTDLPVVPRRIYLTGDSAGGNGTWEIGLRYPDRFAALAPVSGYYDYPFTVPENICDLKDVPVWAFHGANDEIIPLDAEQQLVDALEDCGGNVQFTVYPDAGHDIEGIVYDTPELFTWLLAQKLE